MRNRKLQKKKSKQIQKIRKYHYGFFPSQNRLKMAEKIKIITLFGSCPTRERKLQKNCKKIQKIETFCYGFFSNQNRLEKAEKEKK